MVNLYKLQIIFLLLMGIFLPYTLCQDFSFNVELGFKGYIRESYINPITITLVTGAEYSGEDLEITVKQSRDLYAQKNIYARTVSMPPSSRKQIMLHTRLNTYQSIWVNINDIVKEIRPIRKVGNGYFWLNISSKAYFRFGVNKEGITEVDISPTQFAQKSIQLEAVKVIMINEPQNIRFSLNQATALLDWVSSGGILILSELSQMQLTQTPWLKIFPNLLFNKQFEILRISSGKIAYISHGGGSKKTKTFIKNSIVSKIAIDTVPSYSYSRRKRLKKQIENTLIGELELGWIWVFLTFYLLCIGPLDHYLVKKWKRVTLTWGILILSIIFFSTFAYLKSRLLKSGPMKLASYNFLDIQQDCKRAIGKTFFGVYSTRNANYTIFSENNMHIDALYEPYMSSSVYYPVIKQSSGGSQINIRIPIYSCSIFAGEWYEKNPYPIHIKLQGNDNKRFSKAKVDLILDHNNLLEIKEAYLITKYRYYELRHKKGNRWQGKPIHQRDFGYDKNSRYSSYYRRRRRRYNKNESDQVKIFMKGQNHMKYLSCAYKIDKGGLKKSFVEEHKLDLSHSITQDTSIVLLFVKNSLNPVKIYKENPTKLEMNLIRIVIPSQGVR